MLTQEMILQHQYIRTRTAHELARLRHNLVIPAPTLESAVRRGTIPGCRKINDRWEIPTKAFLVWLDDYALAKAQAQKGATEWTSSSAS